MVHVDEVRRQLEGIEADGQGQRHSQTQESRIFEEEQAAEQGRQAQGKPEKGSAEPHNRVQSLFPRGE